jgi:hypothetical protein
MFSSTIANISTLISVVACQSSGKAMHRLMENGIEILDIYVLHGRESILTYVGTPNIKYIFKQKSIKFEQRSAPISRRAII